MKYYFTCKVFNFVLSKIAKAYIEDKKIIKDIKIEYKAIIARAKDIGKHNFLLSSYCLGAYFIAMNRKDGLTVEENYHLMDEGIRKPGLLKKALGTKEQYFSDQKMETRKKWAKETQKHQYENDWEVEILPKSDTYDFGINYTKCGVCALCKDEGCFEYAKYLCKLDFTLVDVMDIKLVRTKTLANGDDCCDFRFSKEK